LEATVSASIKGGEDPNRTRHGVGWAGSAALDQDQSRTLSFPVCIQAEL